MSSISELGEQANTTDHGEPIAPTPLVDVRPVEIDDGGPAFPCLDDTEYESGHVLGLLDPGMSLRDWFAGHIVSGLCANGKPVILNGKQIPHETAAYVIADAMIRHRAKSQ